MGNTCVGPSFGNGGFLHSVTAALWKTPAQEEIKLHHANSEGSDNNNSTDVVRPHDIEPHSFFPVQNKPPEPITFTNEDKKPNQLMINETKSVQIPTEMKPVQMVNGDRTRTEELMVKPGKNEVMEEAAKRKEVDKPKKTAAHVKRVPCAGLQTESVLQRKTENFKDIYSLGRKLGQGQFGTTFLCVEKATGKKYACKSILKRKMVLEDDVEDVRREIQIMHHLAGHPNVISIVGAYEDALTVHVVMELCTGGELFDRILEKGHFSEREAAMLARVIVGVVETCHSLGVMHRDLKAENFLFVNESEKSLLKSIDFGLSVFFRPGEVFIDVVGSPYYLAPEVLRKHYGPECDVWSAGVIIYILLSGFPPFWDEVSEEIFEKILKGDLDFESEPWPSISENAKDLIQKMLVRDPKKRLTSHQVLSHPWVKEDGVAPDKPLDPVVLTRLKHFAAMNRFKKIAVRVIAESLSEEEIAGLKEMFKMIDTDNSGNITLEELKTGLKKVGADLKDTEISSLMQAADIDNSGSIDYKEFVAAMLHLNKVQKEDHLYAAFSYFDKDGSGYITQDELQNACEHFGLKDTTNLEDIIRDFDQDDDGRIDYNEFVAMMQDGGFRK